MKRAVEIVIGIIGLIIGACAAVVAATGIAFIATIFLAPIIGIGYAAIQMMK